MTDRPSEQLRALADALRSVITARLAPIATAVADLEGERDRLREWQREHDPVVLDERRVAAMGAVGYQDPFDVANERDALRAAVEAIRDECATNWGYDDDNGRYVLVDNVLYRLEDVLGPTIRALGEGGE